MYCHVLRQCKMQIALLIKSQSVCVDYSKFIKITFRHYSDNTNVFKEILHGEQDKFGGITVDTSKEKWGTTTTFAATLDKSLASWRSEGNRCIWFKVHINDSVLVPLLAQKGFNFHHARDEFVMMYKWLPMDSEPNLPPTSHTNLGVGALVFNKHNELLAVSEQHYDYPHWKLPGGYVERGEDIIEAAKREVREETGVDTTFQSLITFRHTHNMAFGNSDIYVLLMMKALTDKITMSQREVKRCKWMKVEEYTNHEHVHAFNRLIVHKALEYKDKKIKLNLQKKRVKWATMVRDMNFLLLEDFNYEN